MVTGKGVVVVVGTSLKSCSQSPLSTLGLAVRRHSRRTSVRFRFGSLCLCLSLSVSLSLCLCVPVCLSLAVSLPQSVCLSVSLPPLCLSLCLSLSLVKSCGLWTLSCEFALTVIGTLKWLSSLPMHLNAGDVLVVAM